MLKEEIKQVYEEVISLYKGNPPQLIFGKELLGHTPKEGMAMNWGENCILINPDLEWEEVELQKAFCHELGHFIHCGWIIKQLKESLKKFEEEVKDFTNKETCEEIADYLGVRFYLEKVHNKNLK